MAAYGQKVQRERYHLKQKSQTPSRDCSYAEAAAPHSTNQKRQRTVESRQLLESIRSLYADGLEPLDIHVRRRIEERTGTRWTPEQLLEVASSTDGIQLEEESGNRKRWLYLASKKKDFVDQASLRDPYPRGMWQALRDFVEDRKSDWSNLSQASSRYDIGKMLHDTLPELQRYSLGQACHIVQLAVKSHKIFGYRDGRLVPYQHSLDFEKLSNARGKQPTGVNGDELVVSSMAELADKLKKLLANPHYENGIQISSVKALMRKHFCCELNETVLGHTKLSTLLSDRRLGKVGVLELLGSEMYFRQPRYVNAIEVDYGRKPRRRRHAAKKQSAISFANRESTVLLPGTADDNGVPLPLPHQSSACLAMMAEALMQSAGSQSQGQAFAWNNNSLMYKDTVVYEPVVHWVPRVVRTFIEFPLPEHERGRRREKSCPARVEGGELPTRMASSNTRRASSEPMGRSVIKEEDEEEAISALDSNEEPMPEPMCTFSYSGLR